MSTSGLAPDIHAGTKLWIRSYCRQLKIGDVDWDNASDPSEGYNCMGFAIGHYAWWEPPIISDGVRMNPKAKWPDGMPRSDAVESFIKIAEDHGFKLKDNLECREGERWIVLYYTENEDRPFWHAARCMSAGVWKSKLAEHSDIFHAPNALDDVIYWGKGRKYMKFEERVKPS
jgi:hypothetical protein